ncbi:hypothetical protein AAL_06664 [Moelleriella libera RCEF 2490]|uniref:Uncharacterized protein n=1 Tax=Moelleriella libera RCEF 2490 TaxID=1081109 RepID=A0A167YJH4_9HYPO|nr:hypothetical protein AAL_06664 [Moelleriella libera RCEF 2490]
MLTSIDQREAPEVEVQRHEAVRGRRFASELHRAGSKDDEAWLHAQQTDGMECNATRRTDRQTDRQPAPDGTGTVQGSTVLTWNSTSSRRGPPRSLIGPATAANAKAKANADANTN